MRYDIIVTPFGLAYMLFTTVFLFNIYGCFPGSIA